MISSVRPYLIFSVLSALFVLSMFYRVSNAVIAPNLIRDLGLNAETLGILGGAYFYSFALLQIPMGPMLDRIGPRIVMTFFPLVAALGAFLFGLGESFVTALFGRIMIGAGMASVLMGSFKVFTLRFSPERFATLVGINLSIGTLGNIIATSPLAYLASTIGWKMTFIVAGGITTLLGLSVFWVLGEEKDKAGTPVPSRSSGPATSFAQSVRMVWGSLAFWQMGAVAFFRYGTFVGLQGLWLGPYLIDVEGYSPIEAGNVLIFLSVGMIVGGPFAGRLSDRFPRSRKEVALWGLALYTLCLFPLVGVLKIESPFWYGFLFFFLGFSSSFGMLIYSHAMALFPTEISGTVTSWVNFFTMLGAATVMPALGRVIESFSRQGSIYPEEAYHLSFLFCFLGMMASLIFYAFCEKEKKS
ncbi:MAG: MFS transporter [Syntrophaceae bacterium]|nr:MFS transporter [Syntrophaceae bacterium]